MKIIIAYAHVPANMPWPCLATTVIKGQVTCACGRSYAEARGRLLDKMGKQEKDEPPQAEAVEI